MTKPHITSSIMIHRASGSLVRTHPYRTLAVLVSLFWHSCLTTLSSLTRHSNLIGSLTLTSLIQLLPPDLNRPVISCQFRLYVVEALRLGLEPRTLRLMAPEARIALASYLLTRYYSLGMVCLTAWLF